MYDMVQNFIFLYEGAMSMNDALKKESNGTGNVSQNCPKVLIFDRTELELFTQTGLEAEASVLTIGSNSRC
jgi:ABC-type enterochelin transport system substrate-binding protein